MPIESAQFISDLNVSNPSGSDQVAELDNHIRLIKQVLKNTFPSLSGAVSNSQSGLNSTVPIGGIIMWSGTLAAIPAGWVLCAGQTGLTRSDAQGTINAPDLRSRFVFGAGDPAGGFVGPSTTGGTSTHSHSGSISGTALTAAQMPSHNHGVSDPGHAHGVYDPGHNHGYFRSAQGAGVAGGAGALAWGGEAFQADATAFTGVQIQGAYTSIGIQFAGGGLPHTHGLTIDTANHLPPYIALAFIMKI